MKNKVGGINVTEQRDRLDLEISLENHGLSFRGAISRAIAVQKKYKKTIIYDGEVKKEERIILQEDEELAELVLGLREFTEETEQKIVERIDNLLGR
jgi:hypothetical protein